MSDRRPFQFGLKAILGLTFLVAVLAWLARGLEPVVAFLSLPYVCLGVVQCVLAYRLRTELRERELGTPRRPAFEAALSVFVLTMPAWFALVVFLLLLHIGVEAPALLLVSGVQVILLPAAVIVTVFSCVDYWGPRRDWRLNLLRLLNLANSFYVAFAAFAVLALGP